MSLPSYIVNNLYLRMRRLNLFFFTYDDPSYVMASVSHICFALLKLQTLVYSSSKGTRQSISSFGVEQKSMILLFRSVHWFLGIDLIQLSNVWNVESIFYSVPQISVCGLEVCNHPFFLVVILDSFEQWQFAGSISFSISFFGQIFSSILLNIQPERLSSDAKLNNRYLIKERLNSALDKYENFFTGRYA